MAILRDRCGSSVCIQRKSVSSGAAILGSHGFPSFAAADDTSCSSSSSVKDVVDSSSENAGEMRLEEDEDEAAGETLRDLPLDDDGAVVRSAPPYRDQSTFIVDATSELKPNIVAASKGGGGGGEGYELACTNALTFARTFDN